MDFLISRTVGRIKKEMQNRGYLTTNEIRIATLKLIIKMCFFDKIGEFVIVDAFRQVSQREQ